MLRKASRRLSDHNSTGANEQNVGEQNVPPELWRGILSFLSIKDLCSAAQVCQRWHFFVASLDGTTWKKHFLRSKEWCDPLWPCFFTQTHPKSWQTLYREHYTLSKLWMKATLFQSQSSCLPRLTKKTERKTIWVGRGCQHETLRSALSVATDYDRILINPGLYDEQFEMSSKIPFELVGNGPSGSVTLIMSIEQNAVTGRLCNLVLRPPWFTSHVIKVVSGHLQVENCQLEDGVVVVLNPGTVHFRYCSMVHLEMSMMHLPISIIENCEFVNCEGTCLTVEGHLKDHYNWAYGHLKSVLEKSHEERMLSPYGSSTRQSDRSRTFDSLSIQYDEEDSIGVASIACSHSTLNTQNSSSEDESSCSECSIPVRATSHSHKVSQAEVENLNLEEGSNNSNQSSTVSLLELSGSGRLSTLWTSDSESVVEASLETSFQDALRTDDELMAQISDVQGLVIRNCKFTKSLGGVTVCQQAQCCIEKCQFKDLQFGIRCLQNAKVAILDNDIHHCGTSGIIMRLAAHGVIAGNDIYYTSEAALDVRKKADPLIQCNRIHHSKRFGILVIGTGRGMIKGNDIYHNKEAGIYVLNRANPHISGNRICHGGAAGISVNENGRGYIIDNFISGNRWGGIDIRHGSNPLVVRNLICNGLADGIVVGTRGKGTIEANTIKGNECCGVWVLGQPLIRMNQIYNNHDIGVSFVHMKDDDDEYSADGDDDDADGASVVSSDDNNDTDDGGGGTAATQPQLHFNTIFHNNGCGILADSSDKLHLCGNAVHSNRSVGLCVQQTSHVALVNNSITYNSGDGVFTAPNTDILVEGNGIYDNAGHGVTVHGKARIVANDIFCNHRAAVTMENTAVVTVEGNRIHSPEDNALKFGPDVEGSIFKNQFYQGFKDLLPPIVPRKCVLDENETVPQSKKILHGGDVSLSSPAPRPHLDPPPALAPRSPSRRVATVTRVEVPAAARCQHSAVCTLL